MTSAQGLGARPCGVGEDEGTREFAAALRRAVRLYLAAAWKLADVRALDAAAAFLASDKHVYGTAVRDMAGAARGLHVMSLLTHIHDGGSTVNAADLMTAEHSEAFSLPPIAATCATAAVAVGMSVSAPIIPSSTQAEGVGAGALALALEHVIDRLPQQHTLHSLSGAVTAAQQLLLAQAAADEGNDAATAAGTAASLTVGNSSIQQLPDGMLSLESVCGLAASYLQVRCFYFVCATRRNACLGI